MKRVFFLLTLVSLLAFNLQAQNTTGTWTLYPPQAQTYKVTVQQPINPDGTSVWSASKGVVPVQFSLALGYGPVVLASMMYGAPAFSYLTFTPSSPMTIDQLTTLSAGYTFTTGNCHGGALRWSVTLNSGKSIFIYYGQEPNTTDCGGIGSPDPSNPAINQSGLNMLNRGDLRYDTSQIGGSFYDTWNDAVGLVQTGGYTVTSVSLVLDAGWYTSLTVLDGSQVINPLQNVTVNDNTFVPLSGSSPTCNLPLAQIEVDRLTPNPTTSIDEQAVQLNADLGNNFRVVDCKYMYNLSVKNTAGMGSAYEVKVIINGSAADGSGQFTLK